MVLFVEAVKAAVRFTSCQILAGEAFIAGGAGLLPPGSRNKLLDAVNQRRRLLGCVGPDIEEPDPPFEGGQCPTTYVSRFSEVGTSFTFNVAPGGLIGPITSATSTAIGPGPAGTTTYRLQMCSVASGCIQSDVNSFSPAPGFIPTPFRADSLPDDCGSLPGVYPPPTTINIDIDIDYDNDEGDPINVTIPFIFAPITVNFDGSLKIPFSFDFGGFTFDGTLDLGPDFDVDINLPPLPRGDGQGLESVDAGDPENEVDPIEAQEKIIGVVVTSEIDSQSNLTNIATQNMPNIVAPRLGSVKFAYSLGATTFWSNDIDIKGQRVFIPCPFSQGADAAVASPVPGVSLSFVEIRGFPLATTNDISGTA